MTAKKLLVELIDQITEKGAVARYAIRLAGSLEAEPYGEILSVYPDHRAKILWIDVATHGDKTV